MKIHPDVFGLFLWDVYKGKNVVQIIERDDGYIDADPYSTKLYFSNYDEWPDAQKKALSYAHGKILDVGCGAGRHSLYFQSKNHDVLAIDVSPLAIKVCKERGVKNAQITDANKINLMKKYDTVLLLGNNFGIYGSPENTNTQLKKLYEYTSDDAVIITNTRDVRKTTDEAHLMYHAMNKKEGRLPGQVKIRMRYNIFASPWFDLLMVSKEEMLQILENTGWRVENYLEPKKSIYHAIICKK